MQRRASEETAARASWARNLALEALESGDWYRLYKYAMAWRTHGGGCWIIDPWLLDIASSLMHRQPKTAVHCCDMALGDWIDSPGNRSILHWLRGSIIFERMNDSKCALADFETARSDAPDWLLGAIEASYAACTAAAAKSRKTKASVPPAPEYAPVREKLPGPLSIETPGPVEPVPADGSRPSLWDIAMPHIFEKKMA